jgi:predicted PurR-regulated permease PerM
MPSSLSTKIIAVGVVLSIAYFAASVIISVLVSLFFAILLDPAVTVFQHFRISRPIGASVMVLALFFTLGVSGLFMYGYAAEFAQDLPKYSSAIRRQVSRVQQRAAEVEKHVDRIIGEQGGKEPVEVVDRSAYWEYLFPSVQTAYHGFVGITIIPFLALFMLTWKDHFHSSYLSLFEEDNREEAGRIISDIASVLRSFLYGNIVLGLILSAASLLLFLALGLPYPYMLALLSGFATLIPYLGAVAAVVIPWIPALDQFRTSAQYAALAGGVLVIHLVGLNLLLPKIVGSLMSLNPLVATAALLVWSWMWGAIGLILAIPIVAGAKAICDNIPRLRPYGRFLGTA